MIPALIALALVAVLAAAAVAFRRRYLVITVRGSSMMPAYADGARLLIRRTTSFGRDDVMVFAVPPDRHIDVKWLLKRVTAVAGDPVPADVAPVTGAGQVPPGCVVVRGDGQTSLDSRQLGYIPTATALGAVTRQLRP